MSETIVVIMRLERHEYDIDAGCKGYNDGTLVPHPRLWMATRLVTRHASGLLLPH